MALLGVGAAVLALVVTLINLPGDGASTAGTSRDGDKVHGTPATPSRPAGPSPGWGFTHTQYSADVGSGTDGERVERLLSEDGGLPQDQALMGWGADNPEPVKGHYAFGSTPRAQVFPGGREAPGEQGACGPAGGVDERSTDMTCTRNI